MFYKFVIPVISKALGIGTLINKSLVVSSCETGALINDIPIIKFKGRNITEIGR